jgi:molybdate transport system substrate-binding protein
MKTLNQLFYRLGLTAAFVFFAFLSLCAQAARPAASPSHPVVHPVVTIGASTDLELVMPNIVNLFERSGGGAVRVVYDSPEHLYQRAHKGERFGLILSGDDTVIQRLAAEGKIQGKGALYALGRLAFYTPRGSNIQSDAMLSGFRAAVDNKSLKRIVAVDFNQSPYGKALVSALKARFIWNDTKSKFQFVDTAAAAADRALYGFDVQGAFVAYSYARYLVQKQGGYAALVLPQIAKPIPERMGLTTYANKAAQQFYGFMQTKRVKRLLLESGFPLPSGESLTELQS